MDNIVDKLQRVTAYIPGDPIFETNNFRLGIEIYDKKDIDLLYPILKNHQSKAGMINLTQNDTDKDELLKMYEKYTNAYGKIKTNPEDTSAIFVFILILDADGDILLIHQALEDNYEYEYYEYYKDINLFLKTYTSSDSNNDIINEAYRKRMKENISKLKELYQ